MKDFSFVIITGISGSGKSQVMKCFEDIGYFCVDNLPIALIPKFSNLSMQSGNTMNKVALGIDIREKTFLNDLILILDDLKKRSINYHILFLEARDEILIRRFSETRRKHPLSGGGKTVLESIKMERKSLKKIRDNANNIIDTSDLTIAMLRETIKNAFSKKEVSRLVVNIISFGYKYGLPMEVDIVLDTRFLANPFYYDDLRIYTGNDEKVKKFVLNDNKAKQFLNKIYGLFNFLIPSFIEEGKHYLTIGIGCTGGRHRSVVISNQLKNHLEKKNISVRVTHRDILKPLK
ncbi:MAG: RNase adapter RapZ [Elusimicrobiota bacterium]